ncbi:MAG: protein TolR [Rhodanobacteraceae bacterium]
MASLQTRSHRRRRRRMAEINIVPYIDVMLVLLIIFMITAPMLNLGADIELPQSAAKALQDKKQPVIVTVTHDGSVSLILGNGKPQMVDDQTLVKDVSAFVKQDPKVSVLLGGDKRVDYGRVDQVLGLLQNAGVSKVGLMSQPEANVVPTSHGKR